MLKIRVTFTIQITLILYIYKSNIFKLLNTTSPTHSIAEIAKQIAQCETCPLHKTRTLTVPGEGDPTSDIMFIGEGPGLNEDKEGSPFIGRAGKLLDQLLEQNGLSRNKVFITNMVKCRPPNNRDPTPSEISSCSGHLDSQIQAIDPVVIVTLGRFSFSKFFPGLPISKVRGIPRAWKDKFIFPMYHPAAALYNPSLRPRLADDFTKLLELVNEYRNIPKIRSKSPNQVEPKQLGLFDR